MEKTGFNILKRYAAFVIVALLVIASIYFIFIKINAKELSADLIAGSGKIDGDLILLNTKYSSRVEKIFVNEGDTVSLGQSVAQLKSDEFINKEKAIEASVKSLEKEKLAFSKTLKAQYLEQALLEKTLPHLVKIKQENLKTLQNSLKGISLKIEELRLQYKQDEKSYSRYKKLSNSKSISKEKFELVELKYKTSKKEFDVLKTEKKKVLNSIEIAKISLQIAQDNLTKIEIAKQNILASEAKSASQEYKIKQLQASKGEIEAIINELSLKSPIEGFVIEKIANAGEVAGAGMVIVTLSDTKSYYLKLFVDTINNGKIKIGDSGVIFVDAYPNKPIKAKVTSVSAKAEFTPKEVSVRSDRIQRVYALHLKPIQYDPILKLGIPAVGIIGIDGADLPKSLHDIPEI